MKLVKFKHSTSNDENKDIWTIDDIHLNTLNLIVGKNAVGKSRVLRSISTFSEMINGRIYWGKWEFFFINDKSEKIDYKIVNDEEIFEEICIDDKLVLKRSITTAQVLSKKTNKFVEISPPANKLVLHIRRDIDEFPYFEEIIGWAEKTQHFNFANIHSTSFLEDNRFILRQSASIEIKNIPKLLKELDSIDLGEIITDFNSLGYEIEDIGSHEFSEDKTILLIKERILKFPIDQGQISQGMFRALALLIFIQHLISKKSVQTLIIDDLCEGLDYERANKLGKLIFNKFKDTNIQLIASSNDCFLMDAVNVNYWNILYKKENTIYSKNYSNSKEMFDNFKFSGLNNFELFSSDYLW